MTKQKATTVTLSALGIAVVWMSIFGGLASKSHGGAGKKPSAEYIRMHSAERNAK